MILFKLNDSKGQNELPKRSPGRRTSIMLLTKEIRPFVRTGVNTQIVKRGRSDDFLSNIRHTRLNGNVQDRWIRTGFVRNKSTIIRAAKERHKAPWTVLACRSVRKKLSRSLLFVNVLLIKSTPATVRKWNHIQELPFPPLKVCWFERRRANSGPWSGGRSTRVSLWASRPRAPPRRGRPLDQRAPDTSAQASFPRVNGEGHRGPQC